MGSFPVQAAEQEDRAEFVRKQLVSMKVTTILLSLVSFFSKGIIIASTILLNYVIVSFFFVIGGYAQKASSNCNISSWY